MALTKVTPGIAVDAIAKHGFKNKIIGGDFTTNPWQRGTSFAAIAAGIYSADRWAYGKSSEAVHTITKAADAPSAVQAGIFTQHCLMADVTTADTSIAAGQYASLHQRIEGNNSVSFGFGQAGTRYVTLSFWHKHTKTGIYCVAIINSAANRSYVAEYTQDVTDTWEKATITIPVDTSGTWLYDNGIGLVTVFTMSAGSTFQTTANTWTSGNFLATANQVNSTDAIGNKFRIALVQLEAGQVASDFETRDVGTELSLCQRYFYVVNTTKTWTWYGDSSGRGTPIWFSFPTQMRTAPSTTTNFSAGVNTGDQSITTTASQLYAFIANNAAGGAQVTLTIGTFSAEL